MTRSDKNLYTTSEKRNCVLLNKCLITLFFVCFIFFKLTSAAVATEYYVATWGNNSNTGLSLENALKTPTYAANKAMAGDIIYLVNGTWYGEHIVFLNSGNSTHPIKFTSYNGTSVLDGIDKTEKAIDLKGNSYIHISNLLIENYGIGISTSGSKGAKGLNISDVEVIHTSGSAIEFSNYVSCSSINNCTVSDNGWNSIGIYGTYANKSNPDKYTHDVTVRNCQVLPPFGHSAIDLFGEIENISIVNNTVKEGQIYFHTTPGATVKAEHLNISYNTIFNSPDYGIKLGCNNSTISDNTVLNCVGVGIGLYLISDNVRFERNTINGNGGSGFFVYLRNGTFWDNYVTNNTYNPSTYDYRLGVGNNYIYNPVGNQFVICASDGGESTLIYKDGILFTENGRDSPVWTTDGSRYYYNDANTGMISVHVYPFEIMPSTENVTVSAINSFNLSLPIGSTIMSITTSSTNGNNVTFVLSNLYPGGKYTIAKDGINISTQLADSIGKITWRNSDWLTAHKFTVVQLNNMPIVTSFKPANESVFNEGQKVKIALDASDADNQTLCYAIKIDGMTYSTSSNYIWNTNYSTNGKHIIEGIVSDGIAKVQKVNTIYINDYHPRWDVNKDGIVDFLDINIIAQNYGTTPNPPYPDWDVNQDGAINLQDLILAESYFGEKVE